MSGTKILWGQVIVVGLIVLLAIWGATEWTAWRLAWQPELGRPWFELLGFKVYYPPVFFWWWFVYDAYAPRVFVEGAFIAASGTFVSIAVAIGMSVWRAFSVRMVWCSASSTATTFATTGRSTCCVLHPPDPARVSVLSSPRSWLGPARPSFTTSRARIGN